MRIFCRIRYFGNRTTLSLLLVGVAMTMVCANNNNNILVRDMMMADESNNQYLTSANIRYLSGSTGLTGGNSNNNNGNSLSSSDLTGGGNYVTMPAASVYQPQQQSNQAKPSYYESIMSEVAASTPTMQQTSALQQIQQIQNSHQNPKPAASNYFNQQTLPTYSEDSNDIYKKSASEYWNHQSANVESIDDGGYGGHGGDLGGSSGGSYHQEQMHGHQEVPLEQSYPEHEGYHQGKSISISSDHKPIALHYRTHAQPLVVHQTRIPGPKPEVKHTTSHEEPHRVVHEVIRPIIQEVHEIIQPYRRVVQQVQPVIEEIRTVIAKDAGKGGYHGGSGGGGSSGGGGGYGGDSYGSHMQHSQPQPQFRKAAVFESDENEGDAYRPMKMSVSSSNHHNNRQQRRSKVYINKQGIPVYESDYMGPAFRRQ